MAEAVIVSATRTAIGTYGGALASVPVPELGAKVITEALRRAGIEAGDVDEVVMGHVLQAGHGQSTARQAALKAGIPDSVVSYTVNKLCGSGLKCVALAAQSIRAGDAEVVVAGGMENMSATAYVLDNARWGYRMGDAKLVDVMMRDGLICSMNGYHMGVTAENIAKKFGITREAQDKVALASQQKAVKAIADGAFAREIVPVTIKTRKGETVFDTDEHPRANVTMDSLSAMKPAFLPDGTVTAGNASGINDGAAALVVMSADKAKAMGLKPLARIVSYASGGVAPDIMGMGPVPATRKALEKAKMALSDIDLIEANEAFAAQFLGVDHELRFDPSKVNVNGGAIALGHPIGASGARILVTLLHAMEARQAAIGLATLCIGGGQGISVIVEKM